MKSNIYLFIGFASFGILIGTITGLTSSPVSGAIITALFAFAGGKILLKFETRTPQEQIKIGIVLFAFSVFCLFGIIAGIYIKVNSLLTINKKVASTSSTTRKDSTSYAPVLYMRSYESNLIELKYRRKEITEDSALQAFFDLNHK